MNELLELYKFNTRWNINFTDTDKLDSLKEKVNVVLQDNIKKSIISWSGYQRKFNQLKGSAIIPKDDINPFHQIQQKENDVIKSVMDCNNEVELFRIIQIIFLMGFLSDEEKDNLKQELEMVILASGYCNIVKIEKKDNVFLVLPVGEKFLDENIINKSIPNLKKYPTAYEIFIDALEKYSYSNNSGLEGNKIINSLRTAYENYLKEKFKTNAKSIDKIAVEIGKHLKEKNIDKDIREMYMNLARSIEKFNNENIKHEANLDISKQEVELFIYLTGTLVRFLESIE